MVGVGILQTPIFREAYFQGGHLKIIPTWKTHTILPWDLTGDISLRPKCFRSHATSKDRSGIFLGRWMTPGFFVKLFLECFLDTFFRWVFQNSEDEQRPTKFPYMSVSKNNGTPKSSILRGFSIIFTIHFGVPLFSETPRYVSVRVFFPVFLKKYHDFFGKMDPIWVTDSIQLGGSTT